MTDRPPQSLKNHTRFDPAFHFFLAPLTLALLVAAIWHAIQYPGYVSIWMAVGALLFLVEVFLNRSYSLKVQDRVIRLEERLRLGALLPESQRARIGDLTEGQLIALRFACDGELPVLVDKTLREHLAPRDIKKAIQSWRPDYFRV